MNFLEKYFTPYEIEYVQKNNRQTLSLAGLFAAKEAFLNEFKKYYDEVADGVRFELFGMPLDTERMINEFECINKFKPGGDGVKICFKNGSSFLVRLSGTEDKAKVYKEIYSQSPQEAAETITAIEDGIAQIAEKHNARVL